jgi:nonsense-mediated mRNA decay protein 3
MGEEEFCVVCGATGRPLVDGVCAPCAAERTRLVWARRQNVVTICPHCGAREIGSHWERPGSSRILGSEDLVPFLEMNPEVGLRRVRWEETAATPNQRELLGTAHVVFRGVPRDVEVPMTVRIVSKSCPDCSRKSGRYYTAIIQLRGGEDDRGERAAELRDRLEAIWGELLREARPDSRKALSWTEELPEGWDCYFTATLPARSLAKLAKQRYGIAVKESSSLAGRKYGQEVYRVTFCLRFPRGIGPKSAPASRRPVEEMEQ